MSYVFTRATFCLANDDVCREKYLFALHSPKIRTISEEGTFLYDFCKLF